MLARMTLGDRIRDARTRAELSQEQLAERAGVYQTTLSRWERGGGENASARALQAIAEATGVSLAWLLDGDDSALPPTGTGE